MTQEKWVRLYRIHRKSIIATVALIGSVVHNAITDSTITGAEWKQIGLTAVTAVLVYWLPNEDRPVRLLGRTRLGPRDPYASGRTFPR